VTFPVSFNGANYQVYVRKRPHLDKFLQWIAGKFEVTIFTASQQVYAEKLLNLLDPEGRYISYRLYRDSCLNVDGNYLKDLNVLGRDMSKMVLVDNSPHAFGYQVRARARRRAAHGRQSVGAALRRAVHCLLPHPLLPPRQLDNGIPIESWFDDRGDTELLKLTRFLETIQHAPDVRPLVRDKFRLHRLVHEAR
jgi:CTD small phosphatase-like protein 2